MNRISMPAAQLSKSLPAKLSTIEQGVISRGARAGLPHATFAPMHYEPNYAYPLVVWLHGQAGDEWQLQKIMPLISMRNYAAVGVRGTSESPLGRGFFWPQHADSVESAQQRIMEAIDLAREKFNINPQRVFVAGYQCGGTMALRMALLNPSLFAGALSIGGRFPEGGSPLARYGQLRQLPLFIAHCRDSQSYTIDRVCDEVRLFHSAGLSVTLRQYPCGDELTTQMLHDADVWMMERVTGMPAAEPESCQPTGDFN